MAAPIGVSDEVWAQLDPGTGHPSRRTRRAAAVAASVVVALLAGWLLAGISGVVWPRLRADASWSASASAVDLAVSQSISVHNAGWASVSVAGVTSPSAALPVVGVDDLPVTVPSGQTVTIVVHYRVTDCSAFAGLPRAGMYSAPSPPAMHVQVMRWWGAVSVPVGEIPQDLAAEVCDQVAGHR